MTEPTWLTRAMVEAVHFDQIREHSGLLGVRDDGLLESALARPRHRWSFEPEADMASLAASYGFGLTTNHPFLDGNKYLRDAILAFQTMVQDPGHTPNPALRFFTGLLYVLRNVTQVAASIPVGIVADRFGAGGVLAGMHRGSCTLVKPSPETRFRVEAEWRWSSP